MTTAHELHDIPPSIGELSASVIARADAARKEPTMQNALEPMKMHDPVTRTAGAMTPMEMVNMAVERGAGVETLEKLMALQERWEANQARKAFDEAIANAKAEITPIIRNATGHNNKRYADFAAIARTVDPIISRFGLSYRFRTAQTDKISVTCILSHKDGHAEETTLAGPADSSGSKNAIQAIGSTLTYLQRYSLVQALGLAAANDDDGRAVGKPDTETVTEEQARKIQLALDENGGDIVRFCGFYRIEAVIDLPSAKFTHAMDSIRAAGEKRRQSHG